ncbi:glycosyltransferase family 8 C-terminal domain-containing protein, partial [Brenneria alni]|uniref:glycosyltransferase family 8 C-terminal domain-containing protein n=1 Tax=Brenneria alni TaxID=71656 RepID=UPI0023E878C1
IKQELKYRDFNKYKETIKNSTSLIHYTGVTKPWHLWAKYPSSCFFYQAYKASPWKDTPLIEAETAKQFKKKSRHERLQGKYIKSIISYCNYIIIKIKE